MMNRFLLVNICFIYAVESFTQNDSLASFPIFGYVSVVFIEMSNTEMSVLELHSANLNFELIEKTVKEIQNRKKLPPGEYDAAMERKRMSQQLEQYRDDLLWKKWQKLQLDFGKMLTSNDISAIQKVRSTYKENELDKKVFKSLKPILKKYQKFLDDVYKETEMLSASRLKLDSKSLSKNERWVLFILNPNSVLEVRYER